MEKIQEVTPERAAQIARQGEPRGLFCARTADQYIGVDTQDLDVWYRVFDSQEECLAWLRRE